MLKRSLLILMLLSLGLILFTGCDSDSEEVENYDPEPVLNAYFEVNQPFGAVQLQRVAKDVFDTYNPRDYGILGVDVRVMAVHDERTDTPLDPAENTIVFDVEDPDYPGKYLTTSDAVVQPFWTYRIEVRLPDTAPGDAPDLWAQDTAPDTFSIQISNPDPDYQAYNQFWNMEPDDPLELDGYPTFDRNDEVMELEWSDSWTVDGNPNAMPLVNPKGGLLLGIWALNPWDELEFLDEDFFDEDELTPEDFDKGGWTIAPDYQNSMLLYWIFVTFEGPHRMDAIAVSHGYYRYMFTRISQFASGGDVPSYEYNINGGLGCFGFWTANSMYLNMERVEE